MAVNLTEEQVLADIQRRREQLSSLSEEQVLADIESRRREIGQGEADDQEFEEQRRSLEREKAAPTPGKIGLQALLGIGSGFGQAKQTTGRVIESPPKSIPRPSDILIPGLRDVRERLGVPPVEDIVSEQLGIRSAGRALRESGERTSQEFAEAGEGVGGGPIGSFARMVPEVVVGSSPTVAASMLGGIPAAAVTAGAQSYAGVLNEGSQILQQREGITDQEAVDRLEIPAMIAGTITAGLTRYIPGGVERLSRNIWKGIQEGTVTKSGVKAAVKELVKESALEMPEEFADEFAQGVILKVSADPDRSFSDITKDAALAGLASFFATGIQGTAVRGLRNAVDFFSSKELSARTPDVAERNAAFLADDEVRSWLPEEVVSQIEEQSTFNVPDAREALKIAQEAGQIRRVGDEIQLVSNIASLPDTTQNLLRPLFEQGTADPATIALLQELPQYTAQESEADEQAEASPPLPAAPISTQSFGEISPRNLRRLAEAQFNRLTVLKKRGALNPGQQTRLDILNATLKRSGKTSAVNKLARLFNVTVNEEAQTIPEPYSFIEPQQEGVTDATQTRQEEPRQERQRTDAGIRIEGQDRQRQAEEQEARPEDRQRNRIPQGIRAALTPEQRRNYQGGPVVSPTGQRGAQMYEVVDQREAGVYTVRDLSTGTVSKVPEDAVAAFIPTTNKRERQVSRNERRQEEEGGQEVLGTRVLPSESELDNEINTEAPIQRGGVTYAPPIDPHDQAMANRIIDALIKLKRRIPSLQFNAVRWVRTRGERDPDIFTAPSETGLETLSVDLIDLVYKLKNVVGRALDRWLYAAMEEEVIHIAGDVALYQQWLSDGGFERTGMTFDEYWEWRHEGMWEDMTDAQRQEVSEAYGISPDDHAAIAAEFVRMVVQRQISGRTTEETLGARVTEYIQGMLRAIQDMVNQLRTGPLQNRLLDHAIAIEQVLNTQQQASQGPLGARRRRLGTKIITAADLDSELIAERSLPTGQVRRVRQVAIIQNSATVGHVNNVWETTSDEIKGHLPFIQERLGVYRTELERTGMDEPSGNIEQQVQSMTNDPDEQATMYWSAWENTYDLLEERINLLRKAEQVHEELGKAVRKPDQKSVEEVVQKVATTHKERLMAQRDLFADQGEDVSSINQDIKRWDEVIKRGSTALERVVKAILQGESPNSLDFDKLKISGGMAAFIQPALGNYSAQGLVNLAAGVVSNEAKAAQQINDALAFLENTVMGDPRFQENYRILVDRIKVEAIVDRKTDGTELVYEHPYDPNVTFSIQRDADSRIDAKNQETLIELAGLMEKYINDPQGDPMRVAAYRRHLANIENIMLNPALRTDAQHIMTSEFNIFKPMTFGGHNATPEFRLEGVGGRSAALAEQANFLYDQAAALVNRIAREKYPKLEREAKLAAKAHGMTLSVYLRIVSNAIIASRQEIGSKRIDIGSKYRGIKITEKDIRAAELMKDYVDSIYKGLINMETEQARQQPLKIQEDDRLIPIRRLAQSSGDMIMPAKMSRRQAYYVQQWGAIIESTRGEPESSRAKRRVDILKKEMFSGSGTNAFWDIIESHMRDAHSVPSYAKAVNSPFRTEYQELIQKIDEASDPNRPLSFESVVDYIFEKQAGKDPEDQMSRERIEEQILLSEIGRQMMRVIEEAKQESQDISPDVNVTITSSNNFLTRPRRGQFLPSALIEYPVATMSQEASVIRAVQQVYTQRLYRSLEGLKQELQTELDRMSTEIQDAIEKEGLRGGRGAQKRIREQQMQGQRLWNYQEAKHHLNQVEVSMSKLQPLIANRRDYFAEEFHVGVRAFLRFTVSAILGVPHVILRNRHGGALMILVHEMAINRSRKVLEHDIPYASTFSEPVKRFAQSGLQTIRWITGSGFLAHKFFNTKAGKEMLRTLKEDEPFWADYAGGLLELARQEGNYYEKLRQFGAAGHAPVFDVVRNIFLFFDQGGRAREDNPSKKRKIIGVLESLAAYTYETGLIGVFPVNLPRNAGALTADMTNNVAGMRYADDLVKRAMINAIAAYKTRDNLGIMDRTELFTPQELLGDRFADEKMAGVFRNNFRKAGINIDQKMIEYARKVDANGSNEGVDLLTDAEYNSFQMIMAKAVNWGTWMNRPEWINTTDLGRLVGVLWGYPSQMNTRFAINAARMSRQSGAVRAAGILRTAKWLSMVVLAGIITAPIAGMLRRLLYDEEQQVPKLSNVETPKEAVKVALSQSGPFMPTIGGLLNYMTESVKPGLGVGGGGIQALPVSMINDTMDTMNAIADTGDWMRPGMNLISRYVPNTRIYKNRFPINEGLNTYYNLRRSIVSSVPEDIEVQQFRPGSSPFRKGSTSDNKDNVINALMRDGGPHWETVIRERGIGIQQLIEDGNPSPEQSFDSAVLARNTWRSALGRTPTAQERQRIMERMNEEQREWALQMERVFTQYAQATGRTLNLVVEDREDSGRAGFVPSFVPRPRTTPQVPTPGRRPRTLVP